MKLAGGAAGACRAEHYRGVCMFRVVTVVPSDTERFLINLNCARLAHRGLDRLHVRIIHENGDGLVLPSARRKRTLHLCSQPTRRQRR